ncbi:MAG: hypothetical protein ACI9ND_003089 [Yoonia sp.]|jgi:hypothetical protein
MLQSATFGIFGNLVKNCETQWWTVYDTIILAATPRVASLVQNAHNRMSYVADVRPR